MSEETLLIEQMQAWVENWVIRHNLCPFARSSLQENGLLMAISNHPDTEDRLLGLFDLIEQMNRQPGKHSALYLLPALLDFDAFLDELALADALLQEQGLEAHWQLASFHPQYRFAEEPEEDASHYTNRAPIPAWHLLRQSEVSRATASLADPMSIPERNIRYLRQMGLEEIQRQLRALRDARQDTDDKPD